MTAAAVSRAAVTELGLDVNAVATLAAQSERPRSDILSLLTIASSRLHHELSLPQPPLEITGEAIRVTGLAGLLRIATGIELEVCPKFLDVEDATWRTDFFIFAMLSRFGRLRESDPVMGGYGARGDLATLVGRAASRMFGLNHRRPLRVYRRTEWDSFDIEGDLDDEALVAPTDTGFTQASVSLKGSNVFNAVMSDAFSTLLPEIRDLDTRRHVTRARSLLPTTSTPLPRRLPLRVPARHRHWQALYDLARQVAAGFGVEYAGSLIAAPGYVVKTVNAWEDVVSLALEARLGTQAVRRQVGFGWGSRGSKAVVVTPDLTVQYPVGSVLVDAKYKGRADEQTRSISAADLYEAFAFSRAANVRQVLLVYPRQSSQARLPVGDTAVFDRIDVDDRTIVGVEVECRSLGGTGGFRQFASKLAADLEVIAAPRALATT